eukprot:CAMPEP_0167753884 /NCGR_PEP_ID=MMETSP0110_2-20121227/7964_1 /TAXON_ID=629695 /ORGANISM="Gymnochlora sp., Strain CCMP2014" /LENGTH=71 /DNA_ID=CAMNT_0007639705 /DNA_START=44 /DNA_END=256 /DNA_ORIENTATION=+
MTTVNCTNCGTLLNVPVGAQVFRCGNCGHEMQLQQPAPYAALVNTQENQPVVGHVIAPAHAANAEEEKNQW